MRELVNHKVIIDELINSCKIRQLRKLDVRGFYKDDIIQELHTVGLKLPKQTGLTTYIRGQIAPGSNCAALCYFRLDYTSYARDNENDTHNTADNAPRNVFLMNEHFLHTVGEKCKGLSVFYVHQLALQPTYRKALYLKLYELAGDDLVIVELY